VLTALHLNLTREEAKVEPGCGLSIIAADPGEAIGVGVAEGVGLGVAEEFGTG
jgi:hypothetical protein